MNGEISFERLPGLIPYGDAFEMQRARRDAVERGEAPDTVFLLEHAPVVTLGRKADAAHVLAPPEKLAELGVALCPSDRGGDVTYHGPGQLVGYPILHLAQRGMGVLDYIQAVEESLIRALAACGLAQAGRDARNRGVWVGNDKIAAIGIRVSHQVTAHGFALNVNTRLADYAGIVPCGLADAGVTSLARSLGRAVDMAIVKQQVVAAFGVVFGYDEVVLAPAPTRPPQGPP